MTYCVAVKLNSGVLFLSDSRTNAGMDDISISKKMLIFKKRLDRTIVILSAGNLAITQSVRTLLNTTQSRKKLWNATSMYQIAEIIGNSIREVKKRDGAALEEAGIEFTCSFILGGQIVGEDARLFKIYSAGNFIEAERDCNYFQIGEVKYGKPILDRVLSPDMSLESAAKCALLSMDSTLRSNISVGLPLDLFLYDVNEPELIKYKFIDQNNLYFLRMKESWSKHLKKGFDEIESFEWDPENISFNEIILRDK
tara:strand:- start:77 stop:838 length:762 start_codon:yes stop_codon:yes gene_type:complete